MINRTRNRLKFLLESLLLRGAHFRLLVIAGFIALISTGAGLLVMLAGVGFDNIAEATWWAFLRLTDPGYLGDDEGVLRRVIATVVTVLGYVIFMGSLIAIMTQWLTQKLRNLERGLTPIAINDHILILGWTNRTATIVRELLMAEDRVKRFLHRRGIRRLNVVVLAEDVDAALVQELRDELGPLWNARRIIFRSGSPLEIDHLRRVDYAHAATILVPAGDYAAGGAEAMDNRTVKTLLSIGRHPFPDDAHQPQVVSELLDARKVQLARKAYGGPIEILASDAVVCRLLAQTVRHPGLSHLYNEFMAHGEGNEIYIRHCPELAGRPFHELFAAFGHAVPLGLVRPHGLSYSPMLNPANDTVVQTEDRVVLLADSYEASAPLKDFAPRPLPAAGAAPPPDQKPLQQRVLILGWNHQVVALLREFDLYAFERFEVDLMSSMPLAERQERLERYGIELRQVRLTQMEGDYTLPTAMERIDPASYDYIVLLGSDRVNSDEEADARTLMGALLLRERLPPGDTKTHLLVELMDPDNAELLPAGYAETLISPKLVSHMLAQVALRRELRAVYDELFGPGGAEIFFRPLATYGLAAGPAAFGQLQERVLAHGDIALGIRPQHALQTADGLSLNPDPQTRFDLGPDDELIVLSTYASA